MPEEPVATMRRATAATMNVCRLAASVGDSNFKEGLVEAPRPVVDLGAGPPKEPHVFQFFRLLFSTDFLPQRECMSDPSLVALHAIADSLIALAYFLIPAALFQLVRRRSVLAFPQIFSLFGLFILGCGITHLFAVVTLWIPLYRLDGLLKAITAIASLATAITLFRFLPQLILIPSPERLRHEILQRERSEGEVRLMNELLEHRVARRTDELEKANSQLAESELRMRSILDGSTVLIAVKDLEGRFTFVNRALTENLGLSRDLVIGHTVEDLFSPELASRYAENDRLALAEGPTQFEEVVKQNNEVATYLSTKFPLLNRDGQPYAICGVSTDITGRKRAEEDLVRLNRELRNSEERFRKIADLVPDMLWSTELNGTTRFLSQRFQQYTGIADTSDGQLKMCWRDLLHPEEARQVEEHLVAAPALPKTWEQEVRLRRADGIFRWFMSRTAPVLDSTGRLDYWLGSFSDIDEIKRTEQALRRSNEELEQFAYAAAHDLQEPLRNISTSLGMLRLKSAQGAAAQRQAATELAKSLGGALDTTPVLRDFLRSGTRISDEEGSWIEESISGARRMQTMIQDLLQYSRVISDVQAEQVLAPVNSNFAVTQALRNLDAAVRETGAQVIFSNLPEIPVREQHLITLFQNLIGNSIKYRQAGTTPIIRISATRQGSSCQFVLADNGIGFDPAYSSQIFKVFKRLHNRDEYSGNGIGLAVCARIVSHYGGRIWAEGMPGQGATFYFTL